MVFIFSHKAITAVYQVTRPGHEHCDATEGILLDITPLVVDGKKLVTLYDKDLTEGVNLLIGMFVLYNNLLIFRSYKKHFVNSNFFLNKKTNENTLLQLYQSYGDHNVFDWKLQSNQIIAVKMLNVVEKVSASQTHLW